MPTKIELKQSNLLSLKAKNEKGKAIVYTDSRVPALAYQRTRSGGTFYFRKGNKQKSFGTTSNLTLKEARQKALSMSFTPLQESNATFREYLASGDKIKPSVIKGFIRDFDFILDAQISKTPYDVLLKFKTLKRDRAFARHKIREKKAGHTIPFKEASDETLRRDITNFKSILNSACKLYRLDKPSFSELSLPRKTLDNQQITVINKSRVEIDQLYISELCNKQSIHFSRFDYSTRLMLALLFDGGYRLSELRHIKHEDVVSNREGKLFIDLKTSYTKSKKQRRVPVFSETLRLSLIGNNFPIGGIGKGDFYFPSANGNMRSESYLKRLWSRFNRIYTETRGIRIHDIRHTFATNLYRETNDLLGVSMVIGDTPEVTRKYYARSSSAEQFADRVRELSARSSAG